MVKGFEKNLCATQFLKKLFNTYLDWVFSWFLNLESWILILILGTWILKLDSLILEIIVFVIMNCSWSLSFLSSPLSSSKLLWINLDSSWSLLLQLLQKSLITTVLEGFRQRFSTVVEMVIVKSQRILTKKFKSSLKVIFRRQFFKINVKKVSEKSLSYIFKDDYKKNSLWKSNFHDDFPQSYH